MAIIDLVSWSPQGNETIFAWRFPHTNLSTFTQLIVQESQEAVLFSKGQILGKFGPGKHTLNTENIPILRSLFGLPFGGKNPFTAEVWFVNKTQPYNIGWSVKQMTIHDADYDSMLPLMAEGQYGLRIVEAEKFLIKVVGTRTSFDQEDMTEQFEGEFSSKTKSGIMQYMIQNRVGFKQISAYLDMLSGYLRNSMSAFWEELGLELTKFYINTIDIDDSTPEGVRVKNALAQQSSMKITGHTWQQEQMFGTANNAIEGMSGANGGGNSLLGSLIALQMMGNMNNGNVAAGMINPQYDQPGFGGNNQPVGNYGNNNMQQPQVKMVYCSNCAKKFPNTYSHCPHCGDAYRPCPQCGTDNDANARCCVSCGRQLSVGAGSCPHCNAPVTPNAAFCGNCGKPIISSDICSRCGSTLPPTAKFCPKCGNKR